MERRQYDQEFKDNAVKMLLTRGKPLLAVARDLGISNAALRTWGDTYLNKTEGHSQGGEGMPIICKIKFRIISLAEHENGTRNPPYYFPTFVNNIICGTPVRMKC